MHPVSKTLVAFYRQRLNREGPVPLHEPWFRGHEWSYVRDCLDSGWVSSVGSYVGRFEEMCAQACGTRHAIATVNGTCALHAALHALGVRRGDIVLCPPLSFVATVNAIAYCGATPLFIDIEPATLGMDPDKVACFLAERCRRVGGEVRHRDGARVAAVVPVHIFGHPVRMAPLLATCAEYGLPVVEDAAEAIGSSYNDRPCGSLARVGFLSFNGNKTVTTGGGGMVLTDDQRLADRIRHVTTTARVRHQWAFEHDEIGYNYRLPNLNAALGCAQMEHLADSVARKRRLADFLADAIEGCKAASVFREQPWAKSNYWLNSLLLGNPAELSLVLEETNEAGLQTRPCWTLLCDLPMYREAPRNGEMTIARDIASRLINVPSSPNLVGELT